MRRGGRDLRLVVVPVPQRGHTEHVGGTTYVYGPNGSTRGIIGARELALLRPGAVLINVARGPLVERAALLDALHSGRLSGAGLDVFWEEPPDPADPVFREAVVATPHVGAVTDISYRATARAFADNIERLRRWAPEFR